jgi:hypothetical protein
VTSKAGGERCPKKRRGTLQKRREEKVNLKISVPRERTCSTTECKVNICKVCEYGPGQVTKLPLRCFTRCEEAMTWDVKCKC